MIFQIRRSKRAFYRIFEGEYASNIDIQEGTEG
jgi:hypothetical protein